MDFHCHPEKFACRLHSNHHNHVPHRPLVNIGEHFLRSVPHIKSEVKLDSPHWCIVVTVLISRLIFGQLGTHFWTA